MRFLILLAWGLFATAASPQTTPQTPVTEQVTVTVYGPWTHGFRTSDNAEAHLREHPYVYVKSAATAVGSEMDGRPISWKLDSVEFKSKGDASHFPFKARAKVEVTLAPWKINIPKDAAKAEAAAEASGEKPIENELDQRIAELEALDAEMSDTVVGKLTSDMLNKVNDIDVMRNTLVSVITRMKSKGPAMGLWKGGNTAHRYVSRLEEMAARVQHVKDSLTGMQDHANGKTTALIDGLLDDLADLETDVGQSLYRTPDSAHANDPDRIAYWEARDALKQSLHDARNHAAIDYDMGMQGERYARSARGFERDRKSREWQEQAAREAVAGNASAATADEGEAAALRTSLRKGGDKDRLKDALAPDMVQTGDTTDPDQSPMRPVKPEAGTSTLRSAAGDDSGSDIRRHAGADGPRTMDADGGDILMPRETGETAPRVQTPRVTSPFDLAREEKERAAQKEEDNAATLRFNELAWLEIDGQIAEENSRVRRAFVLLGYQDKGVEHQAWLQCEEKKEVHLRQAKDEFFARCPAQHHSSYKNKKEGSSSPRDLYGWLSSTCYGNYYVYIGSDRYPEDKSGRRDYLYWWWNENGKINEAVEAKFQCGLEPDLQFVRLGAPLQIVLSSNQEAGFESQIQVWLKRQLGENAEARFASSIENLADRQSPQGGPLPDLSEAPFTLYEDSALKELRDMQQEYQY